MSTSVNAVSDGRLTPEGSVSHLSICDESTSSSHVDTLLPKIDWDTLAESLGGGLGGNSKLPQLLNFNQTRNVRFTLFIKLKRLPALSASHRDCKNDI